MHTFSNVLATNLTVFFSLIEKDKRNGWLRWTWLVDCAGPPTQAGRGQSCAVPGLMDNMDDNDLGRIMHPTHTTLSGYIHSIAHFNFSLFLLSQHQLDNQKRYVDRRNICEDSHISCAAKRRTENQWRKTTRVFDVDLALHVALQRKTFFLFYFSSFTVEK